MNRSRQPIKTTPPRMDLAEFVATFDQLRITVWSEVAKLLGRSPQTVANYLSGRFPIPAHIAERVTELGNNPQLPEVISARARCAIGRVPRMWYRTRPHTDNDLPSETALPPYTMNRSQYECVIKALRAWRYECRLRAGSASMTLAEDARAELRALDLLLPRLPRARPFTVIITDDEWPMCSRALLFAARQGSKYARSFYQTWRRNRFTGPPRNNTHD